MKVVDEQVADVVEQHDGTDTDNDAQAGAAGSSEAAESQTAALSPVAVDEDDNPLKLSGYRAPAGVSRWHGGVYEVAHQESLISCHCTATEDTGQGP